MPTDSSRPRSAADTESRVNVHLTDSSINSASDQTAALALSADQARVLDQLLAPLDRANVAVRIGFFGRRMADRNAVLDYLARPSGARRVRTPEHHKVLSIRLDALNIPEGMQPWHFLTLSAIEALTESALPNERMALNEMRTEANRLIRLVRRDAAAAEMPALAFARHYQSAFPRLVLNTISLANSILLIILNQVDEVDPAGAAQWLEASQYFCATPGCAVLLSADEGTLIDKLNRSAENADGESQLRGWTTHRVSLGYTPAPKPVSPPVVAQPATREDVAPAAAAPRTAARATRAGRTDDVPATSARIIRDVLSPDTAAIQHALGQWHVAMQAVIRRAEQGLGGSISATLVAKLVCLHALAPALYDAVRYDAQMLPALERASKGDESSEYYADWVGQVSHQPRLAVLFGMDPSFSNFDLRDLATGLRLTNADEVLNAAALDAASLDEAATAGRSRKPTMRSAAARRVFAAAQAVESPVALTPALVSTGLVAAVVFLLDRVVKLVVQSTPAAPEGAFIHPEYLTANAFTGNLWGGGLGVGAELFGVVLAVMIAIFWGGTRRQTGHDLSLGLVIGALASNLFDRLAYGSVLNYAHLANLPVFNLSHVALVVGALMIAWSLLRGPAPAEAELT